MIRNRALAAFLALLLTGLPTLAVAAEDDYANAMAQYEMGDDAGALRLFEKALKGTLSDADKLAIYTYAAVSAFRAGDKKKAEQYFKEAVRIDREVTAPYEAPDDAKKLLEDVRAGRSGDTTAKPVAPTTGPTEFKIDRPAEVDAGEPIPLRVRRVKGEIVDVVVHWRVPGGSWAPITLLPSADDGDVWVGDLPAPVADPESGASVEFWLEAQDGQGGTVARFGSEGTPKVTKVRASGVAVGLGGGKPRRDDAGEPRDPDFSGGQRPVDDDGTILEEWWFWTGVGVLVIGGVVTTIVLLSGEETTTIPCDESNPGTGCIDATVKGFRPLQPGVFRW